MGEMVERVARAIAQAWDSDFEASRLPPSPHQFRMARAAIAAMQVKAAILAERDRCANIAASCAKGVAIEMNGKTHLLGVMMNGTAEAQYATACAIMEAIKYDTDRLHDTDEKG